MVSSPDLAAITADLRACAVTLPSGRRFTACDLLHAYAEAHEHGLPMDFTDLGEDLMAPLLAKLVEHGLVEREQKGRP